MTVRTWLRSAALVVAGVMAAVVAVMICAMTLQGLAASTAAGRVVEGSTPAFVTTAKNLGREDGTKMIEVSLWLNPHNRAELDALANRLCLEG